MDNKSILIIAGPTAVGKTEYAIETALRLDGEIVSADSMQLYRYMDIGSAKPTEDERSQVRHYLVDEIDPRQDFSVYEYQKRARAAIREVFRKGKVPVISGGTGLYIHSLMYEMDFSSRPDTKELRQQLEQKASEEGPEVLHRMLMEQDPEAAERIHPNNVKKIIRALEILQTGEALRPFEQSFVPVDEYDVCLIGLTRDRQELYQRIDRRVDLLMEQGLVEEVRKLSEMGLTEDAISMKGIGYKEVFGFLRGEYSREEAVRLIKRNTRRYAKRQLTWLRRYQGLHWVDLSCCTKEETVEEILRYWKGESWR